MALPSLFLLYTVWVLVTILMAKEGNKGAHEAEMSFPVLAWLCLTICGVVEGYRYWLVH